MLEAVVCLDSRARADLDDVRLHDLRHSAGMTGAAIDLGDSTNRPAPFAPLPASEHRSLRRHNENVLGAKFSAVQNCLRV